MIATKHPEIAERRERATELRVLGWSYRKIAAELGVNVRTVFNDVKACIAESLEQAVENAGHIREIELRRIDKATQVCIETISQTDWESMAEDDDSRAKMRELRLKAMDRLTKLGEQRAKLLGLYAPQEVTQTVIEEKSPAEVRDAVRRRFGGDVAPDCADIEDDGSRASEDSDG